MDFLASLEWGLEVAAGYVINVWNCRAAVSRYQGNRLVSADNWEELEEEATEALEALGGAINWSGQYPCPLELAKRGKWDEPPAA